MSSKPPSDGKPTSLEGWLEKKGHGKVHMGGDWQKRYLRVDERTGSLSYSKSSSSSDKSAGSIDLKLAKDIFPYNKDGKSDYTRFNIDIGDRVFKFKANTETEGQRWVEGLNEWKDYFLLNM